MEINSDKQILLTEIFDDFTFDKSIEMLCNEINSIIPSKFTCLSDCDLFSNGLSSISKTTESIRNNIASLKHSVDFHKENIVNDENLLTQRCTDLLAFSLNLPTDFGTITNFSAISNMEKIEVVELENDANATLSKEEMLERLKSEIPTEEEYKKMTAREREIISSKIKLINDLEGKFKDAEFHTALN